MGKQPENNEGWQKAHGKAKQAVMMPIELEQREENCFSPLQDNTFQQVLQAALNMVERGESNKGGGKKPPDHPQPVI